MQPITDGSIHRHAQGHRRYACRARKMHCTMRSMHQHHARARDSPPSPSSAPHARVRHTWQRQRFTSSLIIMLFMLPLTFPMRLPSLPLPPRHSPASRPAAAGPHLHAHAPGRKPSHPASAMYVCHTARLRTRVVATHDASPAPKQLAGAAVQSNGTPRG